jgi:hypothetical protein
MERKMMPKVKIDAAPRLLEELSLKLYSPPSAQPSPAAVRKASSLGGNAQFPEQTLPYFKTCCQTQLACSPKNMP